MNRLYFKSLFFALEKHNLLDNSLGPKERFLRQEVVHTKKQADELMERVRKLEKLYGEVKRQQNLPEHHLTNIKKEIEKTKLHLSKLV